MIKLMPIFQTAPYTSCITVLTYNYTVIFNECSDKFNSYANKFLLF